VAVDRWIGAIMHKLDVSLLLSAFCFRNVAMRTKEQPMRHGALRPRKFRWHKYDTPEVRANSRKVGFVVQAIVSLSRMCAVSQIYRFLRHRFW
jgi:hypothetical protein